MAASSRTGSKSRCSRSTAMRHATSLRATASVAQLAFPFCRAFSYAKARSGFAWGPTPPLRRAPAEYVCSAVSKWHTRYFVSGSFFTSVQPAVTNGPSDRLETGNVPHLSCPAHCCELANGRNRLKSPPSFPQYWIALQRADDGSFGPLQSCNPPDSNAKGGGYSSSPHRRSPAAQGSSLLCATAVCCSRQFPSASRTHDSSSGPFAALPDAGTAGFGAAHESRSSPSSTLERNCSAGN